MPACPGLGVRERLLYSLPMTALNLTTLGRTALDLIYPSRCVLCNRDGAFVCDACLWALPRAEGRRCDHCWLPLDLAGVCRSCSEHPLALRHLRSVFRYEGDVRRLVHAFKFSHHRVLAPYLARPMAARLKAAGFTADVIVPVPLTGLRRRTRGFNQAALLGREIGQELAVPVSEALRRHRFAGPQAKSASAEARRRNVIEAFVVTRSDLIQDRSALLIDDVATTGATLDACARVLLAAGAREVLAVTFARED
jgi:ComF family protein